MLSFEFAISTALRLLSTSYPTQTIAVTPASCARLITSPRSRSNFLSCRWQWESTSIRCAQPRFFFLDDLRVQLLEQRPRLRQRLARPGRREPPPDRLERP